MRQEAVQTEEYRGYTILIYPDEIPEDPRTWDNLGKMVCFHRQYMLGDKHSLSISDLQKIVQRKDVVALPLFLIDHSGIAMRTRSYSDVDPGEWDSGQVGYIYADFATVRKEYGVITAETINKTIHLLKSEVKTYSQYLAGDVCGYVIENSRGKDIGSCWGFFGWEGVKEALIDCHTAIDYDIEKEQEQNSIDHSIEIGAEVSMATV